MSHHILNNFFQILKTIFLCSQSKTRLEFNKIYFLRILGTKIILGILAATCELVNIFFLGIVIHEIFFKDFLFHQT